MNLPELSLQIAYGRLGWALVLAALVAALLPVLLPQAWRRRRVVVGAALAGAAVAMALPGEASLAHGLGLAFQYPSSLLVLLCLRCLHARWRGRAPGALIPAFLTAPIALAGVVLYLDAMGILSLGLYYAGFGPVAAPALALLGAAGCVAALVRGRGGRQHVALLCALILFSLLRLPTGNLWDAVLDPLLWGWALAALARHGLRALGRGRAQRAPGDDPLPGQVPGATPGTARDLPASGTAAPIESFSLSKE